VMNPSIFKAGRKYTFRDYFKFKAPTEEIVAALGYSLSLEVLKLPLSQNFNRDSFDRLQTTYYEILPRITLNSEMAKRDFMIAPLLVEVVRQTEAKLNVEYPIEVSDQLRGELDYLLRSGQELIVIEAKQGDLDRGFNPLAAELIALDQYEKAKVSGILYGAVTIGEAWRFGILKREAKSIIKDLHTYGIPTDTEKIFSTLLGILQQPANLQVEM